MKRPSKSANWSSLLAQAHGLKTSGLQTYLLEQTPNEQQVYEALTIAREKADTALLIAVLRHCQSSQMRAEALGVVLEIIDEQNPLFLELLGSLREGERNLILGLLLETYKVAPDPEHQLLKLRRLLEAMPLAGRSFYWSEAESLAQQGGDDAKLLLLGLARQMPARVLPNTAQSLKQSIKKVEDSFKRTMAYIALSEMIHLDANDLSEAKRSAQGIPDASLRTMALTRLAKI